MTPYYRLIECNSRTFTGYRDIIFKCVGVDGALSCSDILKHYVKEQNALK